MKRDDYSGKTLAKYLRPHDFRTHRFLSEKRTLRMFLNSCALDLHLNLLNGISLSSQTIRGKPAFIVEDIGHLLCLRRAGSQIKGALRCRTRYRHQICESLTTVLSEREPYSVLRLDISSFFESISRDELRSVLTQRMQDLPVTRQVCTSLIDYIEKLPPPHLLAGIPRGASISQFLADLYLEDFDQSLQRDPDIFFYARYVDDIVLLADPNCRIRDLLTRIETRLPDGLKLNPRKTQIRSAKPLQASNHPAVTQSFQPFDYLGYQFQVSDHKGPRAHRCATLDLSSIKRKKYKTRLALSFRDYARRADLKLLEDRIKVISGAYSFYSSLSGRRIRSGIVYSYPLAQGALRGSLPELDAFLRGCLFDRGSRAASGFAQTCPASDRKRLARHAFSRQFVQPTLRHFSQARLRRIVKAWRYVD